MDGLEVFAILQYAHLLVELINNAYPRTTALAFLGGLVLDAPHQYATRFARTEEPVADQILVNALVDTLDPRVHHFRAILLAFKESALRQIIAHVTLAGVELHVQVQSALRSVKTVGLAPRQTSAPAPLVGREIYVKLLCATLVLTEPALERISVPATQAGVALLVQHQYAILLARTVALVLPLESALVYLDGLVEHVHHLRATHVCTELALPQTSVLAHLVGLDSHAKLQFVSRNAYPTRIVPLPTYAVTRPGPLRFVTIPARLESSNLGLDQYF